MGEGFTDEISEVGEMDAKSLKDLVYLLSLAAISL